MMDDSTHHPSPDDHVDMWNHRNKALHEDEANWQEILEEEVNQKICEACTQGLNQLPTEA